MTFCRCNLLILLCFFTIIAHANSICGVVVDKTDGTPLPFVQITFDSKHNGTTTDLNGSFCIENNRHTTLSFRMLGYKTKTLTLQANKHYKNLHVELETEVYALENIVITPTKKRYRRKGNEAVELIKNVIKHKHDNQVANLNNYQFKSYEKTTFALENFEFNQKDNKFWNKFPFIDQYLDTVIINDVHVPTFIFSIREKAQDEIVQQDAQTHEKIVTAERWDGTDQLFDNGQINNYLTALMQDIDITQNDINILLNRFVSPLSSTLATAYYHFFILDTILLNDQSCIDLGFAPARAEAPGFTGHLYILNDSSYALKQYAINVPPLANINWVNHLSIVQENQQVYDTLWAPQSIQTHIRLALSKQDDEKIYVKRTQHFQHFQPIDTTDAYPTQQDIDALRPIELTQGEANIDSLNEQLLRVPLFSFLYNALENMIEEYVPTQKPRKTSYFDIGPIWNSLHFNEQEGTRVRLGGTTTANFLPRWFFSGYVAYGFRDQRPKGELKITHCFEKKKYHPNEPLLHSLSLSASYDLKYLGQPLVRQYHDNLFMSTSMSADPKPWMYIARARLHYEKEWRNQLTLFTWFDAQHITPNGASNIYRAERSPLTLKFNYINNDGTITEHQHNNILAHTLQLRYSPRGHIYHDRVGNESPVNLWQDKPVFRLTNTVGYIRETKQIFNKIEFSVVQRLYLSLFGKLAYNFQIGYIPTKTPFINLFIPEANQSLFINPNAFSLMQPAEFILDAYAQLHAIYHLNGFIINQIPLVNKLKWRGVVSYHILAGHLSDKNNPEIGTTNLYQLPVAYIENGNNIYSKTSFNDGTHKFMPYMEFSAGFENIFRIFRIEYVRRLTHNEGLKKRQKNGVRITFQLNI